MIDLNNIFTSNNYNSNKNDYSSNSNTINPLLTKKDDALESIFSSINLINNQPQLVTDQTITPLNFSNTYVNDTPLNTNNNLQTITNVISFNHSFMVQIKMCQ